MDDNKTGQILTNSDIDCSVDWNQEHEGNCEGEDKPSPVNIVEDVGRIQPQGRYVKIHLLTCHIVLRIVEKIYFLKLCKCMFCNCYLIWNITEHKLNLQELRDVDEDRDPNGGKNEGDGM